MDATLADAGEALLGNGASLTSSEATVLPPSQTSDTKDTAALIDTVISDPNTLDDPLLDELATALAG